MWQDYRIIVNEHIGENRICIDFEEKEIVISCMGASEDANIDEVIGSLHGVVNAHNGK